MPPVPRSMVRNPAVRKSGGLAAIGCTGAMTTAETAQDHAKGRRRSAGAWLTNFLEYGANAEPGEPRVPFYRHTLFVRLAHWLNAGVLLVMLMSGLQIFNA